MMCITFKSVLLTCTGRLMRIQSQDICGQQIDSRREYQRADTQYIYIYIWLRESAVISRRNYSPQKCAKAYNTTVTKLITLAK